MFDLRYHVASLAAVFVALLIGILVGVGLTGKVDDAEKNELRRRAGAAESQLQSINEQQATARRESDALRRLGVLGYPLLMEDRLRERRVALLFVGPVDETVQSSVTTALEDAGARGLTRMRALKLPVDQGRIDSALAGQGSLTRYQGPERLRELGQLLGHEFVVGGDAEAWDELSSDLVIGQSGRARPAVEGVVVVRTVDPQEGDTARFLRGLYEGLADTGVPAVGVEKTSDNPSAIEVFDRTGLSSVDNIETAPGRVGLALLLAGGEPGHYGVKETAERPLPEEPADGG
jgi:hypothetical protein